MSNGKEKPNKRVVRCTSCFKSVSVPSRMGIYNFLHRRDFATVGEIVSQVGLTQPTISHHLKEMKHSGLLSSKRVGKEVHYAINKTCPHLERLCILHGLEFTET